MPVSMVIEDGSGVENANSYVALDYARQWALNRGVTLSADDEELKAQLISACDWIESNEERIKGMRVAASQSLSFPRAGIFLNGEEFPDNEIPTQVKQAQVSVAMAIAKGTIALPNVASEEAIKSERVGPIATEYRTDAISVGETKFTQAESLLRPLYRSNGLSVQRV